MNIGPGMCTDNLMRVDNLMRKGNGGSKTGLYIDKSEEIRGWPTCGWSNGNGRV
jgi:hypothetical protein